MCVMVGRVYQWYTLHIQMGKWWLHFAGKEHTFQESPQNHQICASVPESLQVQRADPWGSGSEVIKTHGIAWMGCVDLQWLNYEDYGYMIWILLPRKWLNIFGSKIPFPQKRRKPQDLKIWRIRVDTPKWRMHDCMACWLRTNCETHLPIERHVGPWIEMWVVVTKLLIWRGLKNSKLPINTQHVTMLVPKQTHDLSDGAMQEIWPKPCQSGLLCTRTPP